MFSEPAMELECRTKMLQNVVCQEKLYANSLPARDHTFPHTHYEPLLGESVHLKDRLQDPVGCILKAGLALGRR